MLLQQSGVEELITAGVLGQLPLRVTPGLPLSDRMRAFSERKIKEFLRSNNLILINIFFVLAGVDQAEANSHVKRARV